jgi:hypothetical protein
MENKYQNAKIYKISDIGNNKCYYGSTINSLKSRFNQHKYDYSRVKMGTLRKYTACDLFDEYQIDNCNIELVELFPCSCRTELEAREGYHIRNNPCINKTVMGRSIKQWYQDNKGLKLEYQKQYYRTHRDRIRKQRKEKYRASTTLKQNERSYTFYSDHQQNPST